MDNPKNESEVRTGTNCIGSGDPRSLAAILERLGPVYWYRQHGQLEIAVVPLTFGRARIVIGAVDAIGPDHAY
jgi:hypothetical protein